MPLPKLSDADRKKALEKAAAARHERAELQKQIKAGKMTIKEVLDKADDPIIGRLKVRTLLESLPDYGKVRAAKVMEELEISESRRVKGLGKRQREELLERFK